jgi:5'-3' exonuclease
MPHRLMLLDTASLYFRAFYGVPDTIRRADGTPVNAVRGLLDMIARLTADFEATHLIACWDDDWRPQWRVDLIPSYKSHRVAEAVAGGPDIEVVPDALEAQIPMIR